MDNLDLQNLFAAGVWKDLVANHEIICLNWDALLEQAMQASAKPDPASELRRILREHIPELAKVRELLPRTRSEALQMIAILIALMSLWVAMHQSDQQLSKKEELNLAHAMGAELRRYSHEQPASRHCELRK